MKSFHSQSQEHHIHTIWLSPQLLSQIINLISTLVLLKSFSLILLFPELGLVLALWLPEKNFEWYKGF